MPEESLDIIIASLSSSTVKQYSKPIREWIQYCAELQCNHFNADEKIFLSWLTQLFKCGASYGTLNNCRAAISLIIDKKVSGSKIVSRFFKGIFRSRPPKARYDKIWDVKPVLESIAKLYPLDSLNFVDLTNRLVLLLALGTAQRVQTLSLIKLNNISKNSNGYEIKIDELTKTSRPGACQPLLLLPEFTEKPELCIAKTLECYINVTEPLRGSNDTLLLTTRKPYKAATTQTISRWIRAYLAQCGIDKEFKAHSTRHASTSAALKKGIDLNTIKSTAGWSKESKVFARFYNRPIQRDRSEFARVITS